jgi:prepilin-type N-terminal cleavage/methylation domain-containing protein
MRSHRTRQAFSLIELLVVIAIIAILVGLLMAAVQKARESANRVRCENNLKQLVLAAHVFHDEQGMLPPGLLDPIGPDAFDPPDRKPWAVTLLPFLEQTNTYDMYAAWVQANPGGFVGWTCPAREIPLNIFFCLSDPNAPKLHSHPSDEQGIHSNYVGCAGSTSFNPPNSPDGSMLDGVFFSNSQIRLEDISSGTSNTLAFGEILVSPDTAGHDTRGRIWNDAHQGGMLFSTKHQPDSLTPDGLQYCQTIPSAPCTTTAASDSIIQTARSKHTNVVNFALSDGSVRGINPTIPAATYLLLGQRAKTQAAGAF